LFGSASPAPARPLWGFGGGPVKEPTSVIHSHAAASKYRDSVRTMSCSTARSSHDIMNRGCSLMLAATRMHTACRGAWPPHSCMPSAASLWGPRSGWRRRFVAGKSCGPRRHTGNGCPAANPAISIGYAHRAFLSRDAYQRLYHIRDCSDGYPRLVIVSDIISCRRTARAQHRRIPV
jgi:hypothetical protein